MVMQIKLLVLLCCYLSIYLSIYLSVQYAFVFRMTVTLGRIDCMTHVECLCVRQGAGTRLLLHASPLSVSLSFTFLKLFLHT